MTEEGGERTLRETAREKNGRTRTGDPKPEMNERENELSSPKRGVKIEVRKTTKMQIICKPYLDTFQNDWDTLETGRVTVAQTLSTGSTILRMFGGV